MERKIGEVFEYHGILLKVVKQEFYRNSCEGCYFYGFMFCARNDEMIGDCLYQNRKDKTNVIFKKQQNNYGNDK